MGDAKRRLELVGDDEVGPSGPVTINVQKMKAHEREAIRAQCPEADEPYWRPRTRAECESVERPCPYVGCADNLYLDVHPTTGNIRINFPDRQPWEVPPDESCARDVAETGEQHLAEIARLMNITRERARQIEEEVARKLRVRAERRGLRPEK